MQVTGISNTKKYISKQSNTEANIKNTTNLNTSKLLASPSFGGNIYLKIGEDVLKRLSIDNSADFEKNIKAMQTPGNRTIFINLEKTNVTGYNDVRFRVSTRPKNFILKHLYTLGLKVQRLITGDSISSWWTKKGILKNTDTDIVDSLQKIVNRNNDKF